MLPKKYGTKVLLIFIFASALALISLLAAYQFSHSDAWIQEYGTAVFEVKKFDLGSFHFPELHFEYSGLFAELYLFLLIGVMWLATVLIARKNVMAILETNSKRNSALVFAFVIFCFVAYYHFSINHFGISGPVSLAEIKAIDIYSELFFKECYFPYAFYFPYSAMMYSLYIASFFAVFFNITFNLINKLTETAENKYSGLDDFQSTYDHDIAVYFNSLNNELSKFSLLISFPLIPVMFLKTFTKISYADFALESIYAFALTPVFLALALVLFLLYQYNNFFNQLESIGVDLGLGFSDPEIERIQSYKKLGFFYKFINKSNLILPFTLGLVNFIWLHV